MWNSPSRTSKKGKRYQIADITVLTCPLDQVLDQVKNIGVEDTLDEAILQRLEVGEFIYALYQVLEALLEDAPIPAKGHTGIQEAVVAELLQQTYALICCEIDNPVIGDFAREATWQSIDRLLIHREGRKAELPLLLEELRIDIGSPRVHRSKKLTLEVWKELLLGEGYLWDEFLWDEDWRMEFLMDMHPQAAKSVTQMAGIDLNTVHALAHTPNDAEQHMAEHYIRYVIWKDEALRVG